MQYVVIANVAPGAPTEVVELLAEPEARRVWDLHLAGIVRQAWYRTDRPGAVLMIEAASDADAADAVSSLPMVEAGLLSVEVIPLTAYDAIGTLFRA